MLPAKIKGLNEDSSDESADEEEERRCNRITKEALEQNTQQIYREALKLQKQNNLLEAERLLQQLLDNDLLSQAEGKVKYVNNRIQPSLVYLKYCCYLNLGNILSRRGEYVQSLDKYIMATELDDTDLNLWYRMGNVAVKIPNYLLAIRAFSQALKRNARHWPSLESIIDATYATGDTMSCLCCINHSLDLDPSYVKGRVLKKRILRKHPFLAKDYGVFFPNSSTVKSTAFVGGYDRKEMLRQQQSEDEQKDEIISESLQKEIDELECHKGYIKKSQNVQSVFDAYLENKTWNNLADLLLRVYNHLNVIDPNKFFNRIAIKTDRNDNGNRISASTTTQNDVLSDTFVTSTADTISIEGRESGLILTNETDQIAERNGVAATITAEIQKLVATSDKETIDNSCKTTTTMRKRKSSPTLADQLKICDKRRSTRNKTVLKNNEPSLSKTLHNFIPADLLPTKENNCSNTNVIHSDTLLRWSEDSFDTMDIYRLLFEYQEENDIPSFPVNDLSEDARIKLLSEERYFDTDKEKSDVEWFVKMYGNDKLLILELLDSYCKAVSAKWRYTWPRKLADNFLKIARILSKHNFRNDRLNMFRRYGENGNVETMIIDSDDDDKQKLYGVEEEANFLLMYCELMLNERYDNSIGAKQQPPNNSNCENYDNSILGDEFSTLLLGDLRDACYQLRDTNINDRLWIRSVWLRALLFVQRDDTFAACSALSSLINDTWWLSSDENMEIRLPNMVQFHSITVAGATRLLNTLQRNKNLDEVRLYFASKRYDRVAEILEDTLKPSGKRLMRLPNENTMPRHCQYELLMASLWQLKNYKELFKWCEVCSYEAFTIYRKSFFDDTDSATKSKWAALLLNALAVMLSCIQIDGIVQSGDTLKPDNLSRLVQTLTNLICHQIESSEPCPEIIADCVTPWLLLANFIDYYAKKQRPVTDIEYENDANCNGNFDACLISPALSLLFIAHEFLGRRSWCCFDDGALLFYTLNVIEPILNKCGADCDGGDIYSQTRSTLSQQVDQIFYCLYSHPFKKNKPRHVQEHNSLGLALTWNRAVQAYSFYRPSSLPQFDAASKLCTISADTETLFKRIVPLVPDEQNPSRFLESINQYLGGSIERIPPSDDNKNEYKFAAQEVADLYYLLGDYYFKNKIMAKAIKYYLFDICWNSSRFDSWAAMALARGSQLEMKFNSCETINNEQEILNKAELTGKCFETALQLDRNQSSLWIEYGVFSYAIHAFCSRLLKQETTNLSLQMFDMLESRKNSFLKTSQHCFNSANKAWLEQTSKQEEVQDERWLNNYMLGKINEKTEEKPTVYLAHYHKASELLDANGAEYPARVVYSSPQYYSVEALEIHYRIHASILKILDAHGEKTLDDSTLNTFSEYLATMARSPFVKIQARSTKCQESVSSSSLGAPNKNEKVRETNRNNGAKKTPSSRDTEADEVADCLGRLINEVVTRAVEQQIAGVTTTGKRKANVNDGNESSATIEEVPAAKKSRMEDNDRSNETTKQPSQVADKDTKEDESDVNENEARSEIDAIESSVVVANSGRISRQNDIVSPSSSPPIEKETRDGRTSFHSNDVKVSIRYEGIKRRKSLVQGCVKALEECIRRFPEHYKSYYRLASHYFRSKSERDIEKSRKYLIETGGLFADRTSKNFFGGIWRIPTGEIDRAGSFAFHMSRSVHLLMDVLRDTRDYKTLLHLSDQLKIKPDLDKKYIRDNEREQLCKEALSLSGQSLRMIVESTPSIDSEENKRRLLLDVYKCYHRLSKNSTTHKDTIFGKLLVAVYQKYTNREDKINFDQILTFCKSLNYNSKMAPQTVCTTPTTTTTTTVLGEACYDFAKSIPQIMNLMMNDRRTASSIASTVSPYHNLPTNEVVSLSQFKPKQSKMTRPTSNFPSLSSIGAHCSISVMPSRSSSISPSPPSPYQPISWHKSSVAKSATTPARSDEEKEKSKSRTLASFDCSAVSISAVPSSNHKKINNASPLLQSTLATSDIESGSIHRPDMIIAGKERPNLVITPVLNNPNPNESGNRPTLQQKLAAKQMSNVTVTGTVSSSLMKSLTSAGKNSISVTPPPVEVSKQLLTSSAVSIFPVNRTTSISASSTASKFTCIKDSHLATTIVSPSVATTSVVALPSDDNVYSSSSHLEHSLVAGRTANETFGTKTNKIDFKFINANSSVIIEPTTMVTNKMSPPAYANELRTKDLLRSLDNNPDLEVIPKNITNNTQL